MLRLNWLNYRFIPVDGYGRFGMGVVKYLLREGVDVFPGLIESLVEMPSWMRQKAGFEMGKTTICLMPPKHLVSLPTNTINFTMYEATGLPDGWVEKANARAQEMFVPSQWCAEVFRDNGVEIPITVITGGIDPDECFLFDKREEDRPFTFMCLGDRGARKGFDIAWTAFYRAFGKSNDVRMVIKCRPASLPYLRMDRSDPRTHLWRGEVDNVSDIYANVDCFVFPTRGEGYGMPPREAAACGIPTIATEFSGTANVANWGIPIKNYTMVDSELGGQWAFPSIDETVEHMKWVYENRKMAFERAREQALWLRQNETWQHTARAIINYLE